MQIDIPTPEGAYRNTAARPLWKDVALECAGTFLFVYISIAGVNQTVLSGTSDQLAIAICFTLGLASGIVVAGASGAHLNPAVTLTMYATDSMFDATRAIGYMLAQLFGGILAGLAVLAVYGSWINDYADEVSLGSFGTLKNTHNTLISSIVDQFFGSALLMFGIMMTTDNWFKPITIGAILGGLGLFQGSNGFAFNLARDLGPRLASSIMFGSKPFTAEDHWFWVPMVIPFFGVPFGWAMHKVLKLIE